MCNSIDGAQLNAAPALMETYPSGTTIDLRDPSPEDVHLEDIAHMLSMTCRYGGAVKKFYSVAEHSLLVYELAVHQELSTHTQLACLLHDAAEAYLGDMVSPAKWVMRQFTPASNQSSYDRMTYRMDWAIAERFGLDKSAFSHFDVGTLDMWALRIESRALTKSEGAGWRWSGTLPHDGELPESIPWQPGRDPSAVAHVFRRRVRALAEILSRETTDSAGGGDPRRGSPPERRESRGSVS